MYGVACIRKSQPLWQYEDVTAKVHKIKSASDLEHLLKYVARVFRESLPHAHVEQRWAQDALHLALSCSSRHCAGRSFQVSLRHCWTRDIFALEWVTITCIDELNGSTYLNEYTVV